MRAAMLLAAANAAAVLSLWVSGGPGEVHDSGTALLAAGRVTGLLGGYAALLTVLVLARPPLLERIAGFDRLVAWHRRLGISCLVLLVAHTLLVIAGQAIADGLSAADETSRLVTGYPGVITAFAALALLIGVVASSIAIARRRLRYESWYFVHLYAYLAVVLAFSHQLATGTDFVGEPLARAYWYALHLLALAAVVVFRLALPVVRSVRHRLRVARVVDEGPGVVSIEIDGSRLDRLKARSGQFFTWRFLSPERWWEAHPFSLSAAPDGRRLRITVKGVGDYTERLRTVAPGTRVIAEGPFGRFTTSVRRRPRVALIAGGIGITPIRALLEDMPGEPGDIAVLYRALRPEDVILRDELDALARRRGAELHYVVGDHRERELLSAQQIERLVPDIAARDVYLCGPPAMTKATRDALARAGVPARQIVTERFAY